jgi:hypothetical protein
MLGCGLWLLLNAAQAAGIDELLAKANAGDAGAQVQVGEACLKGEGMARDPKQAVDWLTKAALQGNPEAQLRLGALYLGGRDLPKNSAESAKWYLLAADQGAAAARVQLARMHMAGAGVAKDDVEAFKWASLALAQGEKQARPILDVLRRRMTPEQLGAANEMLRDFTKAAPDANPPAADIPLTAPPLEQ